MTTFVILSMKYGSRVYVVDWSYLDDEIPTLRLPTKSWYKVITWP